MSEQTIEERAEEIRANTPEALRARIAGLEATLRASGEDAAEAHQQYTELVALIEHRRPGEELHYDHAVVVSDLRRLVEREHRFGRALSDIAHPPETSPEITCKTLLQRNQEIANQALGLKTYRAEDEERETEHGRER